MFHDLIEKEKAISPETETPTLGSFGTKTYSDDALEKKLPELQVRYQSFNMDDQNDVMMLEHIMTKSLQCRENLQTPGDVVVISEQGTFDKEGTYHTIVKYIEVKE